MTLLLILTCVISVNAVYCHDSDSSEVNKIEVSPFLDAMIFSDIVDIMNEFESNSKTPIDTLISGSESDENIDDLLSEYQHYLDKAHKQRINYLEKTKSKNKVPLIRHDRFTNTKPGMGVKYNDYYYSNGYYNPNKFVQTSFNTNPFNIFFPVNPKLNLLNTPELTTAKIKENREDFAALHKRILELPPLIPKTRFEPIKSSCYCKAGQIPCDCKCKTCLMPYDSKPQNYDEYNKLPFDGEMNTPLQYGAEDKMHEVNENTFNIKVKVDIQLPKMYDVHEKLNKNRSREEDGYSKESQLSPVNVPLPYLNFPIPLDIFGNKRSQNFYKHDTAPLHRIIIHKKKKSRLNNNNKKHRKKVMTFKIQPNFDDRMTTLNPKIVNYNQTDNINVTTEMHTTESNVNNTSVMTKTDEALTANETQTEEGIYVMVNISNTSDKGAEDAHKTENSVETEFTKTDTNITPKKFGSPRHKREISTQKPDILVPNVTKLPGDKLSTTETSKAVIPITAKLAVDKLPQAKPSEGKKSEKGLAADSDLLYWPNHSTNKSVVMSKNITTIIYERENKKEKLNMTTEAIRNNRTKALEKAIFGEANWDDVDTVAPVFMSFVGKYLRGALTFCSQNICHSMNCAKKTCVHRTCVPSERWNQRGHCAGTNNTESIATLESIMDLPSNVAFEIVDILQDKMLGKMFGKVTLCIGSKCISFVACKKNFLKSKCTIKELSMGHCPNMKQFSIV